MGANQDLIEAIQRLGGEVRFASRAVDVRRVWGRVTGVELADGTALSTDLVINAADPWCNALNALAGVDLRWTLTPTRIQSLYRPRPPNPAPFL